MIVVDDSAPHCFSPAAAFRRCESAGDVLFTEGGSVHAPAPIRVVRYLPQAIERATGASRLAFFGERDPHEITGCILSSILTTAEGLPATLGLPDDAACQAHLAWLERAGFSAPPLHCAGRELDPALVRRFAERHGAGRGVQRAA